MLGFQENSFYRKLLLYSLTPRTWVKRVNFTYNALFKGKHQTNIETYYNLFFFNEILLPQYTSFYPLPPHSFFSSWIAIQHLPPLILRLAPQWHTLSSLVHPHLTFTCFVPTPSTEHRECRDGPNMRKHTWSEHISLPPAFLAKLLLTTWKWTLPFHIRVHGRGLETYLGASFQIYERDATIFQKDYVQHVWVNVNMRSSLV